MLVAYGDRIGYAATLREALNQVFGAGAGDASTTPDQQASPPAQGNVPPPAAAPGPTGPMSPEMSQAVADIVDALNRLRQAQASGDFTAQGQALADLDAAARRFDAAQAADGGDGAPPADGGGG